MQHKFSWMPGNPGHFLPVRILFPLEKPPALRFSVSVLLFLLPLYPDASHPYLQPLLSSSATPCLYWYIPAVFIRLHIIPGMYFTQPIQTVCSDVYYSLFFKNIQPAVVPAGSVPLCSFRILLSCLGTAHRICMQLNRDIPCLSHSV